ncbi:MAG: hypothetical protein NTX96_03590 [Candidatus Zambryskibacteria bacterium]|nr:hypothetical protein [Candidatus Zambryskibacteria bacterium]
MKTKHGFTLLIAIITTSMLLIVSFVVVNIALKQIVLASASRESQFAFYAADSGTECAVYWDLKGSTIGEISKFDISTPGTIICNGQTISTGTQTVPTIPTQSSVIGGSANSIFYIPFTKGCVIVRVTKSGVTTTIDSRGYNTCDTSALRRYERGVTLTY